MRHLPGPLTRALSTVMAFALACACATPALAAPVTPQIKAKQAEAAAAQKTLNDLSDQVEMRVEDWNAVNEALDHTRAQIQTTQRELEDANIRLGTSQDRLGERARAIYVSGGVDLITVLMGTTSFDDFLTRLDLFNRISTSDAELVAEVRAYSEKVAAAETALVAREDEQMALRQEAEAKKAEVEAAYKRQQSYVAGLNAEVARLVKEEQDRQKRLAEERARQAAAAARNSAAARPSSGSLGASHPQALTVALRYIGVPYVWGGTSPSGFDCSGFTSYVYAQIGIDLPRTSREQYRIGDFIAADQLSRLDPGDLVFFGYDGDPDRVHHVGIYAGNGNYVHAPGTGDEVKVSSLTERIASRGDYVGAVRP